MTRRTRFARPVAAAVSGLLIAMALPACSSNSSSDTLSFCTDPTYPPAEFYKVTRVGTADLRRVLSGADIDIGAAVAHKIGKRAKYVSTPFSKIIQQLLDKKCDAIISLMNDTPKRRTQVSFVDYLAAGQDVMLKKESAPVNSVQDLYGRSVSVATSTTEADFLAATNKTAPAGKQIKVKSYASENDAILALQHNDVEAYFGDAPIVQSAVAADSALVRGAELVKPIPVGIALRPGDSRIAKIQKAVNDLYGDGAMGQILAKWSFTRYAIPA
jgi:polar amino acid transport system substrate-binding protein